MRLQYVISVQLFVVQHKPVLTSHSADFNLASDEVVGATKAYTPFFPYLVINHSATGPFIGRPQTTAAGDGMKRSLFNPEKKGFSE